MLHAVALDCYLTPLGLALGMWLPRPRAALTAAPLAYPGLAYLAPLGQPTDWPTLAPCDGRIHSPFNVKSNCGNQCASVLICRRALCACRAMSQRGIDGYSVCRASRFGVRASMMCALRLFKSLSPSSIPSSSAAIPSHIDSLHAYWRTNPVSLACANFMPTCTKLRYRFPRSCANDR